MAELRLQIPDEVVSHLQTQLGSKMKITDIAREALTLYNWAVDERVRGRLVLSSGVNGENVARLTMPYLEAAARKAGGENRG